jgi:hypothetical protein
MRGVENVYMIKICGQLNCCGMSGVKSEMASISQRRGLKYQVGLKIQKDDS